MWVVLTSILSVPPYLIIYLVTRERSRKIPLKKVFCTMHFVEVDLSLYFAAPFQILFKYIDVKHLECKYNHNWVKTKLHNEFDTTILLKAAYIERERKILHLQDTSFREDPY